VAVGRPLTRSSSISLFLTKRVRFPLSLQGSKKTVFLLVERRLALQPRFLCAILFLPGGCWFPVFILSAWGHRSYLSVIIMGKSEGEAELRNAQFV